MTPVDLSLRNGFKARVRGFSPGRRPWHGEMFAPRRTDGTIVACPMRWTLFGRAFYAPYDIAEPRHLYPLPWKSFLAGMVCGAIVLFTLLPSPPLAPEGPPEIPIASKLKMRPFK